MKAVLGFRVKSGWATAVLLAGTLQSPQAIFRRIVELSDAGVPETKQPYHAGMGILEEDEAKIRRRTAIVERAAKSSVAGLVEQCRAAGYVVRSAGLVVGSQIDPAKIANPHIRAHALEGRLFRSVLGDALKAHGISSLVVTERDIYLQAAALLAQTESKLKRRLAELGRALDGPWRAEEKLAALAAWMRLAEAQ
jgi:hypothetical protein